MDWLARVLGIVGTLGALFALLLHYLAHRREGRDDAVRSKRLTEEAADLMGGAEGSTRWACKVALTPEDTKRFELARRKLEDALVLNSENAHAFIAQATLYNQIGRSDQALGVIERARQCGGRTPAYFETAGNTLVLLGLQVKAQELVREGLGLFPGNPGLFSVLGRSLAEEGKVELAVEQFAAAAELTPTNWTCHLNLGSTLLDFGDLDRALDHCLRAVRLKPDSAEAHQNLGVALGQRGKAQEALGCFQEAARLNPWLAYAHCNVGQTIVHLMNDGEIPRSDENVKNAFVALQIAIDRKPDLAKPYAVRGLLSVRLGDFEKQAQADFTKAIQLDATDPFPYEALVELLEKTGRVDEAAVLRREALEAGVELQEERNWLAWGPAPEATPERSGP